nr:response regulator [Lachnospiraceae bacterium]
QAKTAEAYLSTLKLSYAGRVWIVFACFLFTAKMCRRKIPRWLSFGLVLVHLAIYLSILTVENCGLYYSSYEFTPDPVFPTFSHGNGPLHDLLLILNVIFVIVSMRWLILEYKGEKNRTSRRRLLMLILSFGVQSASYILQMTKAFDITRHYDLTMPGVLIGTVFLLIGILGFDLLGAREIARDFAIDRISEGVIAVDNNGRIQYYNEPAARLYPEFDAFYSTEVLGIETEEKKKLLSSRTHTPYDIIAFVNEAIEKGESLQVGDRIFTPEVNDLVYKGENYGKLYALVDDTDHYQYMDELQKQRDIADSANEAKSRFLANMSHEIRTPINAMLGMDEMILRESSEKPIRAYASDIMSAGRTLLSLINDILDLSKVEEGKMEIIPVQYELSSLIGNLVNMTRERAAKKGLAFHVTADEHIPRLLFGDEIRIRQCVTNLLTNAVKYTESGSVELLITFEKKDEKSIYLSFTVKDTGIGMKAEDMEVLFSPYKRIEEERNRSIEGTGLGMSITRQLLDLMGSKLVVHSEYGKGSEFSFAVEQTVVKWDELGTHAMSFDNSTGGEYEYHELFHAPEAAILVVDDTEINLTVIQNLLKKTGLKIDTAMSGKEALELTAKKSYDAIFIDHMMPDMDGIETLKHLREDEKNREVPAVALTANAVSGAREMYMEAGFTDYLSKPVDGERLEKMLFALLPAEKVRKPEADPPLTTEESAEACDTEEDLFARLSGIPEIDVTAGAKNSGSKEGLCSVLSVFHQTAQAKAKEIEDLLQAKDIENYTIKVHALKSSARIIGALDLSEHAKALEDAGKRKDTAYINDHNQRLLEMYRALDEKLKILDRTEEDLPKINAAALKEAYQTIMEIAGCMDYGMMEDMITDVQGYDLPKEDRLRICQIEKMLMELDWDGISSVAKEGIGS